MGRNSKSAGTWFGYKTAAAGTLCVLLVLVYYLPRASDTQSSEWRMYPREWQYAADIPSAGFTHMTYNILCDGMMREYIEKNYMDCGSDWLNLSIRQSRMMKEIETVDPDILCVQEMDQKLYDSFWYREMSARGYDGVAGVTTVECVHNAGQAIFWKRKQFQMNSHQQHLFHDLVKPYSEKILKGAQAEEFDSWIRRRNLILLAELQEKTSGSKVIVGCPHFSHKQSLQPVVQMLQIALGLQVMESLSKNTGASAMILSGDFNTPPDYPAYDFITSRQVTKNIKQKIQDMTHLETLDPVMQKFAVNVLDLIPTAFTHNVELRSAYVTVMGREPLLTYLGTGTMDYIWYTPDHLGVSAILKEPDKTKSMTRQEHHICSEFFGSDHLPIVAKLLFKQTNA